MIGRNEENCALTAEKSELIGENSMGTVVRSALTGKTYGVIFATSVEIVAMTPRHKNYEKTGVRSEPEDGSFTKTVGNYEWTEGIFGVMCPT